jgi:protein TonB
LILATGLSATAISSASRADEVPNRDVVFPHGRTSFPEFGPVGPYYPERAARMGAQGRVVLDCHIAADQRLQDCRVISESPPQWGFSEASMIMAERHWVIAAPRSDGAPESAGERGLLTIEFKIGRRH